MKNLIVSCPTKKEAVKGGLKDIEI